MKIILFSVLFFFSGLSAAQLSVVSSKNVRGLQAQGQFVGFSGANYWMSVIEPSSSSFGIAMQPFIAGQSHSGTTILMPSAPFHMASSNMTQKSIPPAIAYLDLSANFWVAQLNKSLTSIDKAASIESVHFARQIVSVKDGYLIGGQHKNPKVAALFFLSRNLKIQKKFDIPVKKTGEVSRLLVTDSKIFAITKHSEEASYIHEFSLSGAFTRSIQLRGYAASGTLLKNQEIAVVYRVGQDVFAERLDSSLISIWSTKIDTLAGVYSAEFAVHALKNGIAVVTSNNNRLYIYRVNNSGALTNRSSDSFSGYGEPGTLGYLSMVAENNDVHVRGVLVKQEDLSINSVHFIDRE